MTNETEIEKEINDKGLNAPRLTPDLIDKSIVSTSFTLLPSGKTLVCELILDNGFSVEGISSTISPEDFDQEIAEKISFENARNKVWKLECYRLQQQNLHAGRATKAP